MRLLNAYSWPGNVRELENEIERIVIMCDSGQPLSTGLVSERIRGYDPDAATLGSLKEQLARLEKRLILEALDQSNQNKSHAAEVLGITRQTIISKLKQYDRD